MPGGHLSNCASPSVISYQGALEPTKMCSRGRTAGSPSTVPSTTSEIFPECDAANGDPHWLQKNRSRSGEER